MGGPANASGIDIDDLLGMGDSQVTSTTPA